ncbi:SIR2 family protein [Agrobacterium tumefaciens]|uniref:SIR2 family protein n=1 Tax=Agrobacterium tumefaciens TaxID=358 RepID=UPI0015C34083
MPIAWADGSAGVIRAPFESRTLFDLKDATLLIGSGLSSHAMNGLPPGFAVSKEIFRRLLSYSKLQSDFDKYWAFAENTPFEQLLNDHPFPKEVQSGLKHVYAAGKLNEFQRLLATLVSQGNVGRIITTNYDTCIEDALREANVDCNVIVELGDENQSAGIGVFKIHGSADSDSDLIVSLRQEGTLPPWKLDLLTRYCEQKAVYVLGYSGRDFDICPVLFSAECQSIDWLERDIQGVIDFTRLSANLRYAAEGTTQQSSLRIVPGDFAYAFGTGSNPLYRWAPVSDIGPVIDVIFAREPIDLDRFKVWAINLFQAISCCSVAEAILGTLAGASAGDPLIERLRSDLEERRGKYLQSARTLSSAAAVYERNRDWEEALRCHILQAWRYYTGGFVGRFFMAGILAWARSLYFRIRGRPSGGTVVGARFAYLSMLRWGLLERIPQVSKLLRWKILRAHLNRKAALGLREFYGRGFWQEFYLMSGKMHDLGLEIPSDLRHILLPAALGFDQLGNLVGDAAAYRRREQWTATRSEALLTGLQLYGLYPEIWKSWASFRDVFSPKFRDDNKGDAIEAYKKCDYGIAAKFAERKRIKRLGI